jgi:hypothetical protein
MRCQGVHRPFVAACPWDGRPSWLQYPHVSYTDLDNLICKKSEEEVSSGAEGGEHNYAACAPSWLNGDVIPVEIVVCSTSQLRGYSLPSLFVPSAHQTRKVLGDNDYSDLQINVSKSV